VTKLSRRARRYYRSHTGMRWQPRGRVGAAAAAVLGAVVAVAAFTHAAPVLHGGTTTTVTTRPGPLPDGHSYTPASWARALLTANGDHVTACNTAAITAWERAEGGHWAGQATYNPLNTTRTEPGSRAVINTNPGSPAGPWVQAYTSWRSGLAATIATLNNGRYPAILSALAAGNDAQAVASAVSASPWGTAPFSASC
jgi:hypothetical protein